MSDINFKVNEMHKLIDCLDDGDLKSSMSEVLEDLKLLHNAEIQSEHSWESVMMALIGTEGIGGVKRIVIKMLESLESIAVMPPETAAGFAPIKAKNVLSLIKDEKFIAREEYKVFNKMSQ